MSVSFRWLAHSAFAFSMDGRSVYVDPFITNNPLSPMTVDEADADVILISHGHNDHVGDAVTIAQRTKAPVVSNVEIAGWLRKQGAPNVIGMNTGGTVNLDFMTVKLTLAFHSSSLPDGSYGGMPNGMIISMGSGLKVYYAGDTALFRDMELIGDEGIDVAFLPIGDYFTMGISDSIRAINFIRPRMVVPMHYNTFPPIVQNVAEWARRVHEETRAVPIVLDPGQSYTFP